MQNNKLDNVRKRIDALEEMSLAQLQTRFEDLFGFPCGQTTARNLRLRLAHRIQEIYLGGLEPGDIAILDNIADKDPLANLQRAPAKRLSNTEGARFLREWRGVTHEVIVLGNGKFEYNGEVFKSLTAVAGKITGTHWSGKAFFGVK